MDADGRIRVDRYVAALEREWRPFPSVPDAPPFPWREPPTFDVLRPDGRLLGTLVLPPNVRPLFSRGLHVWGIVRGSSTRSTWSG